MNLSSIVWLFLTTSSFCSFHAQSEIKIRVNNVIGSPIANAKVYFLQSNNSADKTTDFTGEVTFRMSGIPTAIIAYDQSGQYGFKAIALDESAATYNVILPGKPRNEEDAGEQFDEVVNTIGTLYGYYRTEEFFRKALNALSSSGVSSPTNLALGAPGVFSLNPIAIENGKPVMKITGILKDEIVRLYCSSMQKLVGNYGYYDCSAGNHGY